MKRLLMFTTFFLATFVLMSAFALTIRPAVAQDADLTLDLTTSTTRAKVGHRVKFTVRLENTGTESIQDVLVQLGLPDALDARAMNCPGGTLDNVTLCDVGDIAPGARVRVVFTVEVGAREPNGPVTAFAQSGDAVLATDQIAPLTIFESSRR